MSLPVRLRGLLTSRRLVWLLLRCVGLALVRVGVIGLPGLVVHLVSS
jgi:hypothetical protein